MMNVKTGTGKTYNVQWIAADGNGKQVLIYMDDTRPISVIAADFEGVEKLEKTAYAGTKEIKETFEGYTHLCAVQEQGRGTVLITLEKP